jgi:hypothetical protein
VQARIAIGAVVEPDASRTLFDSLEVFGWIVVVVKIDNHGVGVERAARASLYNRFLNCERHTAERTALVHARTTSGSAM